jgi:hypothetical protein
MNSVKRYRFVAQTQTDGKVDRVFDSAECVNATDYDAALERIRVLEDGLHRAQYEIGELGRSWSATIVSSECQRIQRNIKAVYDRLADFTSQRDVKP